MDRGLLSLVSLSKKCTALRSVVRSRQSSSTRYMSTSSPLTPNPNIYRLANRTAMITGGSSGIGYAIAKRFLAEGASKVILVGRRSEKLQSASEQLSESILELRGQSHGVDTKLASTTSSGDINETATPSTQDVETLVGDISNATEWLPELENALANVDILVNAAGISISNVLPRTSPDAISTMLKTNLEGAIYTSRAMLKACMRARSRENKSAAQLNVVQQRPSRCIINISSLLALKGQTGTITYAASKAGLLGLTRSTTVEAADLLRGGSIALRCNAIVPGYIATPMIQDFSTAKTNELQAQIPLHRFGDPREVADAAVFLASNEYANNCVLNLDGGLSAI